MSEINITPTGLNVIAKPITETDTKTNSGIYIPSTVQRGKFKLATVVAAGKGAYQFGLWIDNPIKKDDVVIYDEQLASLFSYNKENFVILENQVIKGKINKEE
jgi:co-chaperonin GroES (HSP10)